MSAVSSTAALPSFGHTSSADRRVELLGSTGLAVLRYSLVVLVLMGGLAKFTAFEATAIRPLVEHSPFMSWLYPLFGLRGTSAFIGVFEVVAALLIATRRW